MGSSPCASWAGPESQDSSFQFQARPVGRVFPSTHPLGWGECPHEPILIALPRIRFSPSCGHPSAPTGRPTTARGTAPGNPPQKENQPQALKGRTSLSARSLSTSSPETPFQGSFLLWAANPGRCPGLSSPAPLGLASDRVRPLRIASDKSAPSRPEPVLRRLDGVSPHPRKTSTRVRRVSPRAWDGNEPVAAPFERNLKPESENFELSPYFFTFSPRSFRASPVDSLAFLSASFALSWAFLAASLACSLTLAAASFTLS